MMSTEILIGILNDLVWQIEAAVQQMAGGLP